MQILHWLSRTISGIAIYPITVDIVQWLRIVKKNVQ